MAATKLTTKLRPVRLCGVRSFPEILAKTSYVLIFRPIRTFFEKPAKENNSVEQY